MSFLKDTDRFYKNTIISTFLVVFIKKIISLPCNTNKCDAHLSTICHLRGQPHPNKIRHHQPDVLLLLLICSVLSTILDLYLNRPKHGLAVPSASRMPPN